MTDSFSVIDYTQLPNQIILDLINADNGTAFTPSMLMFGLPTVMPDGSLRNTQLKASAIPESGLRGDATFYYNRIDINTRIADGVSKQFYIGTALTWKDLIPQINFRFGINLTIDDFIDGALNIPNDQTQDAVLQIAATSLVYLGQLTLSLIGASSSGIPLSSVITDTYLGA